MLVNISVTWILWELRSVVGGWIMRDGVISENVHPKFLGGVEQMFDEHFFVDGLKQPSRLY